MKKLCKFYWALLGIVLTACASQEPDIHPDNPEPETPTPNTELWHPMFSEDAEYVALMGDVQNYVSDKANLPYFRATMEWLRTQVKYEVPIRGVLFDGDLTDSNGHDQWAKFADCFSLISDTLLSVTCSGNHDYDWARVPEHYTAIKDRASCHLTFYADSRLLRENLAASFRPDSIDNVIVRLPVKDRRLHVVALEFGTRPDVLEWASRYVSEHPADRFIILTHELLQPNGDFVVSPWTFADEQFAPYGLPYATPEEVFQKLAYSNPNVIAMICGHNNFSRFNATRLNVVGRPVPIVLFNLQYQENGGNGLIEFWEFPRDSEVVNIRILNTLTGELLESDVSSFSFTYN